jgi:streptogramin lyase
VRIKFAHLRLASVIVFSSAIGVVALVPLASSASVSSSSAGTPLRVGRGPCCLAVAGGSLWLGAHRDGKVKQINPKTGKVVWSMKSLAFDYGCLLAVDGKVWLLQFSFPDQPRPPLTEIDPKTHERTVIPGLVNPTSFAASGNSIWVSAFGDSSLREVDASTGTVTNTIDVPGVTNTVIGLATPTALWLTAVNNFQPVIDRVDPLTGNLDLQLKPFGPNASLRGTAAVGNSLWVSVAAKHGPTLVRLDMRTNRITYKARPKINGYARAFPAVTAPGNGTLWLQTGPDSITQINPTNGRSIRKIPIPLTRGRRITDYWNSAMAAGFGSYWLTSYPGTGGLSDPSVGTLIRVRRP